MEQGQGRTSPQVNDDEMVRSGPMWPPGKLENRRNYDQSNNFSTAFIRAAPTETIVVQCLLKSSKIKSIVTERRTEDKFIFSEIGIVKRL